MFLVAQGVPQTDIISHSDFSSSLNETALEIIHVTTAQLKSDFRSAIPVACE